MGNTAWMAFDVPKHLSMALAAGQQKVPASGKSHMRSLQSCCQCGSKEQGSSRGAGKGSDMPWLTAQHPQEMPVLLQSTTCVVPFLSQSDCPSPAWACQLCCTHAMDARTSISGVSEVPEVPRQCISIKSDWAAATLAGVSKHGRKCLAEADVGCPQLLICNNPPFPAESSLTWALWFLYPLWWQHRSAVCTLCSTCCCSPLIYWNLVTGSINA